MTPIDPAAVARERKRAIRVGADAGSPRGLPDRRRLRLPRVWVMKMRDGKVIDRTDFYDST
jgi:hypothetical protein